MTLTGYTGSDRVIVQGGRGPPFTPATGAQPAPSPRGRALTPDQPGRALVARDGQAMADSSRALRDLPLSPFFGPLRSRCRVIWKKVACWWVPVCAMGVDLWVRRVCPGISELYSSTRVYARCGVNVTLADPS